MSDATGEDVFERKYIFKTALVNTDASVSCRYNADQNKYVTRFCSWSSIKGAYWEDANFSACDPKSNATKELIFLSEV